MAIDVLDALTALGSSGVVVFARDWYLTRKTLKSTGEAEERNSSREPIVREGMLLNDAIKATNVFKDAIEQLKADKDRLTDEVREAKSTLGENIRHLTYENNRIRDSYEKEKQEWREIVTSLTTKVVRLEAEVDNLKGHSSK
jgi:FtsZ-binding cell division protein ZapB